MCSWLLDLITIHYTFCLVITGTAILGITCGLLGTFSLLRGQSLFGDAMSHATLPGVACAFLLTLNKSAAVLMLGGAVSATLAAFVLLYAQRSTRLKLDTLLGTLLSVFFGCGLIGMTMIQKLPLPHQSVLNKFIFGSASTLLPQDVYLMASVSAFVIACLAVTWKSLTIITFDAAYAHTTGYTPTMIDTMLTGLLILTIAVGLQTVGVILMSALLIAPAAAARQWTTTVARMAVCSAMLAVCATTSGVYISYIFHNIPTGPTIVVIISLIAFSSLYITPHRILTTQ